MATCPAGSEELPVGHEMLDPISERLVRKTFVTCDSVLAAAGLKPADLYPGVGVRGHASRDNASDPRKGSESVQQREAGELHHRKHHRSDISRRYRSPDPGLFGNPGRCHRDGYDQGSNRHC